MKISYIIRRSVAVLLITSVAVCVFGCSDKEKEDQDEADQMTGTSISRNDIDDAFHTTAEEYGLEEFDWEDRFESETRLIGLSSINSHGDDAEGLFASHVGVIFSVPPADVPEIREITVFYLGDDDEMVYGHYIIFEDEDDCNEYRDLFYEWFGDEVGEEKGCECFTSLTDERMNAVYRDGNTLIWITGYLNDAPEMLPYLYEELGLNFPEISED